MEKNLFAILRTKERLHQIIIKFLLQIKFDLPFLLLLKSRFPILIFLLFVDYSYKPKKSLYFLLFFCFYLFWLYKSLVQIFFVFVSKFYRGLPVLRENFGRFCCVGNFWVCFLRDCSCSQLFENSYSSYNDLYSYCENDFRKNVA